MPTFRSMKHRESGERVAGIAPKGSGFGYAVFEQPYGPIDWGTRVVASGSHEDCLRKIRALLEWFQPSLIVVENFTGSGSRRGPRVQALIRSIALLAKDSEIPLSAYSRGRIRQAFEETRGVWRKDDIATSISKEFKEFAPYLPPARQIWMSEDRRMLMFDAAALVLTHRHMEEVKSAA